MKRRFVATIALFFLTSFASLSYLQFHYFEQERARLLDQQIERSASDIISAGLGADVMAGREAVEELIYDALDEEPLNQVIFVRTRDGQAVYENQSARAIDSPALPAKEGLRSATVNGHYIRYLTYAVPGTDRLLQVGLVLDQREIVWKEIRAKILGLAAVLILLFVGLALLLTNYLLKPVRELALYFEFLARNPAEPRSLPPLAQSSSEFVALGAAITRITGRWRDLLEHHGTLLARLAHEIRTPLTVVRNKVEELKKDGGASAALAEEALGELAHAEALTRDFLTWTKLEAAAGTEPELHAIPLSFFVKQLACVKSGPPNLVVEGARSGAGRVFANPEHLRLVIDNLVENGRRYGDPARPLTLRLRDEGFELRSFGPPLPETVLANLGRPFNRGGDHPDSTGLGLANVVSVCKRYGWAFTASREEEENVFRVRCEAEG